MNADQRGSKTKPLLELQSQGKLNDAWIVRLLAEVNETGRLVRRVVVRVIEEIENVGCEAQSHSLLNLKVFENRDVLVPRAWPDVEILRIPTEIVRDGGRPHLSIGKSKGYLVAEVSTDGPQDSLRTIYGDECLQLRQV